MDGILNSPSGWMDRVFQRAPRPCSPSLRISTRQEKNGRNEILVWSWPSWGDLWSTITLYLSQRYKNSWIKGVVVEEHYHMCLKSHTSALDSAAVVPFAVSKSLSYEKNTAIRLILVTILNFNNSYSTSFYPAQCSILSTVILYCRIHYVINGNRVSKDNRLQSISRAFSLGCWVGLLMFMFLIVCL